MSNLKEHVFGWVELPPVAPGLFSTARMLWALSRFQMFWLRTAVEGEDADVSIQLYADASFTNCALRLYEGAKTIIQFE